MNCKKHNNEGGWWSIGVPLVTFLSDVKAGSSIAGLEASHSVEVEHDDHDGDQ